MLTQRNESLMVRHEIECRRTILECGGVFFLPLEWESHLAWSFRPTCNDSWSPHSPEVSVCCALPALLGMHFFAADCPSVSPPDPVWEGWRIRTYGQELKDKPSLRKFTEMLRNERKHWFYNSRDFKSLLSILLPSFPSFFWSFSFSFSFCSGWSFGAGKKAKIIYNESKKNFTFTI